MSEGEVDRAGELYIRHYHESPESLQHLAEVKARYQRLINLATDKAISELNYPFNVQEMRPYRRTIEPGGEPA